MVAMPEWQPVWYSFFPHTPPKNVSTCDVICCVLLADLDLSLKYQALQNNTISGVFMVS